MGIATNKGMSKKNQTKVSIYEALSIIGANWDIVAIIFQP